MWTHEANRGPLNVVVAEDSPTQAELLRQTLDEAGYAVTVTGDGHEALAAARRLQPQLLITDVVMPGMDGYALCRAVKADPLLRDTAVMVVTSLRDLEDIVTALECGADNFIRKPFDPDALLARIEYLLANRRLRAHSKLQMGVEITLGGRKHLITAEREQILDLLFSSYEEALQANEELLQRQKEIQSLNLAMAAHAVELEDANQQLRAFSHTVSHDLRTPLLTIRGFCSMLEQRIAASVDEDGRQGLAVIRQEAERMARTVDDVLYLANIDRTPVRRTLLDLAALARETMAALQKSQPGRALAFECAATAPAACDEQLVRIALANLLGNAWKFTGRRELARIAFTATQQGGETVFCVRDNGAGFDMRQSERLFKPFERLHRKDEFDGFGVGLATVQRVMALHGGRLWAEAAVDQGAAFFFTLGEGDGGSGAGL